MRTTNRMSLTVFYNLTKVTGDGQPWSGRLKQTLWSFSGVGRTLEKNTAQYSNSKGLTEAVTH